jgi:hypothetical protein
MNTTTNDPSTTTEELPYDYAAEFKTPAAIIAELFTRYETSNGLKRGVLSRIAELVGTSVATTANWFNDWPLSRTPNRKFYGPLLKVLTHKDLAAYKTGRKTKTAVLAD